MSDHSDFFVDCGIDIPAYSLAATECRMYQIGELVALLNAIFIFESCIEIELRKELDHFLVGYKFDFVCGRFCHDQCRSNP
jgi:hypothetical protein